MEVGFVYSTGNHIAFFQHQLNFSSSSGEEVVLEACYLEEMVNMAASKVSFSSSLYFYLTTTCEIGILLPFSPFTTYVLTMLSVPPSRITHNSYSLIKEFGIICWSLGVDQTIGMFFSFYCVIPLNLP